MFKRWWQIQSKKFVFCHWIWKDNGHTLNCRWSSFISLIPESQSGTSDGKWKRPDSNPKNFWSLSPTARAVPYCNASQKSKPKEALTNTKEIFESNKIHLVKVSTTYQIQQGPLNQHLLMFLLYQNPYYASLTIWESEK